MKYLKEILLSGILICLIALVIKNPIQIVTPQPQANVSVEHHKFMQIAPHTLGLYDEWRNKLIIIELDENYTGYTIKGEIDYEAIISDPAQNDKSPLPKLP